MKVKMWKVHFQNQNAKYWGDHEDVIVVAPNARCAIDRACKKVYLFGNRSARNAVESVDLIGVSQN